MEKEITASMSSPKAKKEYRKDASYLSLVFRVLRTPTKQENGSGTILAIFWQTAK
jgi:hypothetical protein